jgi:hypothetical protein
MTGFREMVDVCGLLDLGFEGCSWTFEKKVAGGPIARLDLIVLLPRRIGVLALGQHIGVIFQRLHRITYR